MNKVIFTEISTGKTYDSYSDWGLLLVPREIPFPEPNLKLIEVEGRDGSLDLTESLTGDVNYLDREFTLEFHIIDSMVDWPAKLRMINNAIHGKRLKVVISNEPDYYYVGRCSITEFSSDLRIGLLAMDLITEPYKYKATETTVTQTLTDTAQAIVLPNERRWVIPTVTVAETATLTYNGSSLGTYQAGTHKIINLKLKQGDNEVLASGSGDITFTYREGGL